MNATPHETSNRIGAIAAFAEAAAYMIGIGMYVGVLDTPIDPGPTESLDFVIENEVAVIATNIMIYLVFGVALVFLVLSLRRRLATVASDLVVTAASAFGLIWATVVLASGMITNIGISSVVDLANSGDREVASTALVAIEAVTDGLGGGAELIGAIWVLMVTAISWPSRLLPRWVDLVGIVVGVAGVLTVNPSLTVFQDVFGLAQIPWFIGVGMALLAATPPKSQLLDDLGRHPDSDAVVGEIGRHD